jgi:hypothetical protein
MFRTLDRIYFRFVEAFRSFKDPNRSLQSYIEGRDFGEVIGNAKVRRALDQANPDDFQNQHFKLGYYYASETAKKVMQDDNGRDSVD